MTVFKNHKLSTTEVVVMGFGKAGWIDLIHTRENEGKTVYGFGDKICVDDAIYTKNYSMDVIQNKASLKERGPQATRIAQELKNNIYNYLDLLEENEKKIIYEKLVEIFPEVTYEVKEELKGIVEEAWKKDKFAENLLNFFIVNGYDDILMIHLLQEPLSELVKNKETNQNKILLDSINKFIDKSLLGRQLTLVTCKTVLVNTLQENIRRYHAQEPLIPIEMVIQKEVQDEEKFNPNIDSIKNKEDLYLTSAEMRMAYKLMQEIPDPEIQDIMKCTFTLKAQTSNKEDLKQFITIDSPWDNDDDKWKERTRNNKISYLFREKENRPTWVNELIEYNHQCKDKSSNKYFNF